jgi:hypothetical protein
MTLFRMEKTSHKGSPNRETSSTQVDRLVSLKRRHVRSPTTRNWFKKITAILLFLILAIALHTDAANLSKDAIQHNVSE